ncbi:hypothetical protein PF011_g10533 [Phytophthora fragariae]|uniref:Uncharacterized protein n=1 Tax=Phytophthora fragariae TaxID=53985 RepID=A0A6A3KU97_9STRA|nr:hypothetical protein PF011_g10533 [Phytophthora fragariae]
MWKNGEERPPPRVGGDIQMRALGMKRRGSRVQDAGSEAEQEDEEAEKEDEEAEQQQEESEQEMKKKWMRQQSRRREWQQLER